MAGAAADQPLQFLQQRVTVDAVDFLAWNKLAELHLKRFRDRGDLEDLSAAASAAEQSLKAIPAADNPGALAARARAELAGHRFAEARATAEQLRKLEPAKPLPLLLLTDALLELGEYSRAAETIAELVEVHGDSVDARAREAQLALIQGRNEEAQEHLPEALEQAKQLGVPSPETVAWCHVRLGELLFRRGDWASADQHYASALLVFPGYWAAEDHRAELLGAQGRIDEAVAIYEKLIARTPRPELQQALGDLLQFSGQAERARLWHERALSGYLASVEKGHVLYYHHLSSFFADSVSDPQKALTWARKDLELRQSIAAHDALAWALYQSGQIAAAAEAAERALATSPKDPHLLYHTGMIRMSAGDLTGGRAALQKALQLNPRYHSFHVHR
jgi:tetratricopeptide (TPR) repeat protein